MKREKSSDVKCEEAIENYQKYCTFRAERKNENILLDSEYYREQHTSCANIKL